MEMGSSYFRINCVKVSGPEIHVWSIFVVNKQCKTVYSLTNRVIMIFIVGTFSIVFFLFLVPNRIKVWTVANLIYACFNSLNFQWSISQFSQNHRTNTRIIIFIDIYCSFCTIFSSRIKSTARIHIITQYCFCLMKLFDKNKDNKTHTHTKQTRKTNKTVCSEIFWFMAQLQNARDNVENQISTSQRCIYGL